ncbi:hypothetical protein BO71DRAFT_433082 [Aspergillus ellipticus CBS 707.79]|uniref:Mitochondrial division protein 1 n=1 Tax=Aspergillus ellipticus CBS 707.79 TaxID=1448320 RepID=A0A319D115_9EURO|nr:hypothetical protein BO71DRAFT_433082 [Aspergillus ellipticus CBS 707.79]
MTSIGLLRRLKKKSQYLEEKITGPGVSTAQKTANISGSQFHHHTGPTHAAFDRDKKTAYASCDDPPLTDKDATEEEHDDEKNVKHEETELDNLDKRLKDNTWSNGLWNEAYSRLEREHPGLIGDYERVMLEAETGNISRHKAQKQDACVDVDPEDRQGRLQKLIKSKLDAVHDNRLMISVGGKCLVVKDQFQKILLSNALTQSDDAVEGLRYISEVLVRLRVVEGVVGTAVFYLAVAWAVFQRFMRNAVVADDWGDLCTTIRNIVDDVEKCLGVLDRRATRNIEKTILKFMVLTEDQQLKNLHTVEFATFAGDPKTKDYRPPFCLEGTRKEILQNIETWAEAEDENCIFWLSGMAGTGKSTIARSVAQMFTDKNCLGASFFFARGQRERAESIYFIPTLAKQLARTVPDLVSHLSDVIKQDESIPYKSLSAQWSSLILDPLSNLGYSLMAPLVLVLVIDALDECKGETYVKEILGLLSSAKKLKIVQLRIFVTSRHESYLAEGFKPISGITQHRMIDTAEDEQMTRHDIRIYLSSNLARIANDYEFQDWPGEQRLQRILGTTGRLFIAAATVIRFLEDFPDHEISMLPGTDSTENSSTEEIDEMYLGILQQAITNRRARGRLTELFQTVVGTIIILMEKLSKAELSILLHIDLNETKRTIRDLHSVLVIPQSHDAPIDTFHLSFHDFLVDKRRCTDESLWIDEKRAHLALYNRCLDRLNNHLSRDICRLRDPGVLAIEVEEATDTQSHELHIFVSDARRFIQYYCSIIQEAPLQVYHSAAIFTPTSSVIGKHFYSDCPHWIERLPVMHQHWNRLQLVLEGNAASSISLAFSPDGTGVASGSRFSETYTWDINTGEIKQTLEGCSDRARSLNFSADGTRLTAVSADNAVWTWSTITGQTERIAECEQTPGEVLAVSPDGATVAFHLDDHKILVWNTATGESLQKLPGNYEALSFVEDGTMFVVLPQRVGIQPQGELHIWNARDGTLQKTLKISDKERLSLSVAFSLDGSYVATGGAKFAQIWSMTNADEHVMRGSYINALAFSQDNTRLAFGDRTGSIRIWNISTRQMEHVLNGGSDAIRLLAFQPGNQRLLSVSGFSSLHVWNLEHPDDESRSNDDLKYIMDLGISADGTRLTIQRFGTGQSVRHGIINASTGLIEHEAREKERTSLPPSCNLIAFASYKGLQVRDISTGQLVLDKDSLIFDKAYFSPDSTRLAASSGESDLTIWDLDGTGKSQTIQGKSPYGSLLTFSADGSRVASDSTTNGDLYSSDTEITIWNINAGLVEHYLVMDTNSPITALAFSSDIPSSTLASGSFSGAVWIWDVISGHVRTKLNPSARNINSLSFSPGGTRIAIGVDETVRI